MADFHTLMDKISRREARVAVIGLGYVGLPLILGFAHAGFPVLGLDTDPQKITKLRAGQSYFKHIPPQAIAAALNKGRFETDSDLSRVAEAAAIIICLPIPLGNHLPALAITLYGMALVNRDGVTAIMGGVVTVGALAVVSGVIFAGVAAVRFFFQRVLEGSL